MSEAVADTSVLVAFSGVDRLDILQHRYSGVVVPVSVFDEIVTDGEGWTEAVAAQRALREGTWLKVQSVAGQTAIRFPPRIGAGEREAILLARASGRTLLVDDRLARKTATANGVVVEGSLAILAYARRAGVISATRPLVLAMVANGIHFGESLLKDFFQTMNE